MSPSGFRSSAAVPWLSYGALSLSMALVGSYVGLSKVLVAIFPIFLLAWLRFGIAALAMVSWLRGAADEPALGPKEKRLLFLESFLGNFLFSICMLYGVAATSAVSAGVMMAGIPAMVALLSWLFLGERIRPLVLAGIVLAVCGMGMLALARPSGEPSNSSPSGIGPLWGHVLLLGAVFCEACYVVIGKRLTAQVSPKRISALINLWGLVLVTPLGLWQASQFDFSSVTLPSWGLLLFYALAASVVTVWLWMVGLQRVPAQRAGVFSVLLPIAACAVGVLFLSEPLGMAQGLALGLAVVGLLLATWPSDA